jgi:CheY-like chemotaxis protein
MALPLKVLVVDDDECMRRSITMILDFHGFAFETATSTCEAIDKMASQEFDVILTDLRMSGPQDGLTVLEAARKNHPQTLTLLMSASPDMSGLPPAIELRSDEIVQKPIDIPALIRKLENLLPADQRACA